MSELQRALDAFQGLADETYPGSKRKRSEPIQAPQKPSQSQDPDWDKNTRWQKQFKLSGQYRLFFTIGALAAALGKSEVTIRKWISDGIMPDSRYRSPKVRATGGLSGARVAAKGEYGRRLWTREQIEGIIAIAADEGVLSVAKPKLDSFSRCIWHWWQQEDQ